VANPSAAAMKPELVCLVATSAFVDSIRGKAALGRGQLNTELLHLHLPSHSPVASCGGGPARPRPLAPSASLPPPLRPPPDVNAIGSLCWRGEYSKGMQNTVHAR
jgi:hypothetical protein